MISKVSLDQASTNIDSIRNSKTLITKYDKLGSRISNFNLEKEYNSNNLNDEGNKQRRDRKSRNTLKKI